MYVEMVSISGHNAINQIMVDIIRLALRVQQ